ncbi:glycosyltransferase family 2 protein [Draconibacterium orientale]|uniref:glycosyltransferase family 2 protein n=1 Tax=Draconibacterium orientale TaxID=1168034 RepID=UPI0029C0B3AA|nr:glycosyltransferase family 2 protein [Draconibacterium orientale]
MKPFVSIITPSYNSIGFIDETINSIINQKYSNWELLITDDCSTDETWNLLERYASRDKRIKIFKLDCNSGPGFARNNSINHASGRFIAFCDSDDQWKPDKLEKQLAVMLEKDCALSFSSYSVIDEDGNHKKNIIAKDEVDYRTMLRNNYIGCLTAMYDTEKVGKMYMPKIRKRQDWALWLSILKKSDKAFGIKEPLAIYRDRNDSISTNKLNLLKYNRAIYREVEGFSKFKSNLLILRFLFFYFCSKI